MVLGRSAGLNEDKLTHIGDDPLPADVYADDEAAIVCYAQASSRLDDITDDLYGALSAHFDDKQLIELCFTVGMSNMINRFHATFHTDVDEVTQERLGDSCPIPLPELPG